MAAITKTATIQGRPKLSLSRSPTAGGAGSASGPASMPGNLSTRWGVLHIRGARSPLAGGWLTAHLGCPAMDDLDRAVHAVVRECLGVKEGEEALVVCNPVTQNVGERLREEAVNAGADAVLTVIS